MKIYWCSKHSPLDSQLAELRRLFGAGVIVQCCQDRFADAAEILARFRQSCAQEIVLVAPLTVVKSLTELGVQPLWAEMEECDSGVAELTTGRNGHGVYRKPKSFRFSRFRRVVSVDMNFAEVEPCPR